MISLFIFFSRATRLLSFGYWSSRRLWLFRDLIHGDVLQIGSSEAVHDFMFGVTLLPEESQLISLQYHEMLLVALGLRFEIAVTRVFYDIFLWIGVLESAKTLQDYLICGCLWTHDSWASTHLLLLSIEWIAATLSWFGWVAQDWLVIALQASPARCLISLPSLRVRWSRVYYR